MAVIGNIQIGMLVDNSKLKPGFDKSASITSSFGKTMKVALAGAFAGFTAAKALEGIGAIVMAGSHLNESLGKTKAVLGDASDEVIRFADEMGSKFGLVKAETLDTAAAIGGVAKGLGGLSGVDLSTVTKTFTMLAADLTSFADIDAETAKSAILAGLSGNESDILKGLGAVLTEDTVKAYAFSHGIAAVGTQLTQQQKFAARSALILEKLHDVNGNLALTSGDVANALRAVNGRIENLAAETGMAFQGVSKAVVGGLNAALGKAAGLFDSNNQAIKTWAETATQSGGIVNRAIATTGDIIAGLVDATDFVSLAWHGLGVVVNAIAADFMGDVATLIHGVDTLLSALGQAKTGYADLADAAAAEFKKSAMGHAEAFKDGLAGNGSGDGVRAFFKSFADGASMAATQADNVKVSINGLTDAQLALSKGLNDINEKLREQVSTFGMSGAEADLYKLQIQGATEADLAEARALVETNKVQEHFKDLKADAKSLIESTQTPLEKFREQLAKIDELKSNGLLDADQATRATAAAQRDLSGSAADTHAGALSAGSAEARSAILKFQSREPGQDGIKSVAENTKAQVVETKAQTVVLKDVATKLGQQLGEAVTDILGVY